MAANDLYDNALVVPALAPVAARTDGTVNGLTIDRKQGRTVYRSVMFAIMSGTVTDGTHTVNVQDSPNGTDWTNVADGLLQGTKPVIDDEGGSSSFNIGYRGHRRYVRLQLITATATTGGFVDAVAVLGFQGTVR